MKFAMVGLGRMGMNMAKRLIQTGHEVVVYNRTREKTDEIVKLGATGAYALADLREILTPPRIVWLMLPAGGPVDEHLDQLNGILSPGDIVIDGGNTHFKDDIRRHAIVGEGHPLYGRGGERRHLGAKRRLLPYDWGRSRYLPVSGAGLQIARA